MVKKKSQLEDYKYLVAVVVGSVLITTVLVFIIGRPLYANIKNTSTELTDKQLKVERLEEKLENLKNLESRKDELEKQSETVLAALPEDKDVARLFVQFESIFNESGATISSVSESSTATSETASGIITPVTYQVSGTVSSYSSLKDALTKLENALRILSITSIDISGEEKDLTSSFTINTYVRGQE